MLRMQGFTTGRARGCRQRARCTIPHRPAQVNYQTIKLTKHHRTITVPFPEEELTPEETRLNEGHSNEPINAILEADSRDEQMVHEKYKDLPYQTWKRYVGSWSRNGSLIPSESWPWETNPKLRGN